MLGIAGESSQPFALVPPNQLPDGVVGKIGEAIGVDFTLETPIEVFQTNRSCIILGIIPYVTEADTITVPPIVGAYAASSDGVKITDLLVPTELTGVADVKDGEYVALTGKTYTAVEGVRIFLDRDTAATAVVCKGNAIILGMYI
jgi:hypothetical protein